MKNETIMDPTTDPPTVITPTPGVVQGNNIAALRVAVRNYNAAVRLANTAVRRKNGVSTAGQRWARRDAVSFWAGAIRELRVTVERPVGTNVVFLCGAALYF